VEEYLDKLLQPEKVKGVTMDMHEPFRQAVQMCLSQAKVVTDKFHLIRHITLIRGFSREPLACHCEEPQATWQSLKIEASLLRGVYPEPEILRCPFAALRASAHQNDKR